MMVALPFASPSYSLLGGRCLSDEVIKDKSTMGLEQQYTIE